MGPGPVWRIMIHDIHDTCYTCHMMHDTWHMSYDACYMLHGNGHMKKKNTCVTWQKLHETCVWAQAQYMGPGPAVCISVSISDTYRYTHTYIYIYILTNVMSNVIDDITIHMWSAIYYNELHTVSSIHNMLNVTTLNIMYSLNTLYGEDTGSAISHVIIITCFGCHICDYI